MNSPLTIVLFGSSSFAVPMLQKLLSAPERFMVTAVVSQPDKPAGRKGELKTSPVSELARKKHLPLIQPETLRDEKIKNDLAAINADVFIVAAYGKILPSDVLSIPRVGCLNLHASLLPKYRGASPIQSAILEGEYETGVTLMLMDPELDHGPILAATKAAIQPDDTFGSLQKNLATAAADLLAGNLEAFAAGKLLPKQQNHSKATMTKIIKKEDGLINWNNTAEEIERKTRAYNPWPGCYATWKRRLGELRLKIIRARAIDAKNGGARPGTSFVSPSGLPAVQTKKRAVELLELQLEGKRPMDGAAFLRGHPDFIGSKF